MSGTALQMVSYYVASFCFWGSAALAIAYLFSPDRFRSSYANGAAVAGFVLLTVFFFLRWQSTGFLPVSNMFESLAFFIWAVALVYLVVEYFFNLPTLASFLLPIIMVFSIIATIVARGPDAMDPKLKSVWFFLHVVFAFIGYAAFVMAFASALMYLLQRRQLKSKKSFSSILHKLPSLEVLDNLNQKLINMGFPLFTISIAVGIYWAHESNILGPDWNKDPKIVFTGITWLLFAALFHIRLLSVVRGKRVAHLTIVAFIFMLLTFLGSKFLAVGPHEFLQ